MTRIKEILSDLIEQTKNQSNELSKINYVLRFDQYEPTKDLSPNEIDVKYEKTSFIIYELKEKIKRFIIKINNRSNSDVTKHPLNPSLTSDEINKIAFQMMKNELFRLEQNITNYNFFLNTILYLEEPSHTIKISTEEYKKIKINCLMFLLNCDYELDNSNYQNYQFSYKTKESIFVRKSMFDNGKGQMVEDRFTIKANIKDVAKIIRDSASHGEYYYEENGSIRIENSEDIPRINMNISFVELYNYIITNLSEETKDKYKWLFSLLETDNIAEFINSNRDNKKEISKQLIVLSLFNIIQYNLQHHFKDESMHSKIDLSMFNFNNHLSDDKNITSELSEYDKLLIIKNAIGHGNIHWDSNFLILENRWIRKRNKNNGKNKDIICSSAYLDILDFMCQQSLYHISTISQSEYAMYESSLNSDKRL